MLRVQHAALQKQPLDQGQEGHSAIQQLLSVTGSTIL
jgi:hypothetical protein